MRTMYSILNLLYANEAKSKLIALTRKQIQTCLEEDGERWTDRTIWTKLKTLYNEGLVDKGMKSGHNEITYYISNKGIAWLKDMERNVDEEESNE